VFLDFFPGGAAVGRAIEATAGAAAIHAPGCALGLPKRCEQNVGIAGIETISRLPVFASL
jgi:hypothetical protein